MLQTKDPLMRMKDMCADSGYTKQHFYNQIKQGKLAKPIKYGRDSRWPLSEYEKWKHQSGHQA
ncbi:AlpA family transcriptional regulator [Tatumella punctata]|uniref:Helix-turn-helix transcriptional regulator n=1 Tax=Tatumella punctata TaxID=399969 RepID=A0ABW1VNR9_9GAMM